MTLARMLVTCMLACAGCAHLPDGEATYYLAQTSVRFKVVRTIACDKHDNLLSSSVVTPVVAHRADTTRPVRISYAQLRNDFFADSDVKLDFYPDGRLQGVNAALTGHGEDVLKALTSIVSAVALGAPETKHGVKGLAPCKYIEDAAGGRYMALTLNYEGDADPSQPVGHVQRLEPDALSKAHASNLGHIGAACAVVEKVEPARPPFTRGDPGNGVLFVARQPALVSFSVKTGDARHSCANVVWRGVEPVAQLGTEYELPLNRAPVFGKQQLVLTLDESGAATSLQYATTSGTAAALGVIDNGLATARSQAQKETQAITDEINLRAAQQHLLQCRADPAKC